MLNNYVFEIITTSLVLGFSFGYVKCPDNSACPNYYTCCPKGIRYSCCEEDYVCCNEGFSCCAKSLALKEIEATNSMVLAVETRAEYTELRNYWYGAYILIDNFLNTTQLYQYSRATASCKREIEAVTLDVMKTIELIHHMKNQTELEFFLKLTEMLSEVFHHARNSVFSCEDATGQLGLLLHKMSEYVHKDGYMQKVLVQAEKNYIGLIKNSLDAYHSLKMENYAQCGKDLGFIFNTLFIVDN